MKSIVRTGALRQLTACVMALTAFLLIPSKLILASDVQTPTDHEPLKPSEYNPALTSGSVVIPIPPLNSDGLSDVGSGVGLTIGSHTIHLGDTLEDVRNVLGQDVALQPADTPDIETLTHLKRMIVYDRTKGVKLWFTQSGRVKGIDAIRGFDSEWHGIRIGEDTNSVLAKLGEPTRRATIPTFVPTRYIYQRIDGGFIIDFGDDGRVFSMTVSSGQWGM